MMHTTCVRKDIGSLTEKNGTGSMAEQIKPAQI